MADEVFWLRDSKSKMAATLVFDDRAGKVHVKHVDANKNSSTSSESFKYVDVVGCHRMKGKSSTDRSAYVTVFTYPYREQQKKPKKRTRKVWTFQVSVFPSYERNVAVANVRVEEFKKRCCEFFSPHRIFDSILSPATSRRKLLVFVNPFSGPGRALQMFQQSVLPVFAEADISCRLVITEKINHAKDLVMKMDLSQWDGIVIVSGDGLVFEVLNGLANRSDRDRALRIPLGIIPGGSGNALAAACCFRPTDSCKFDYAVDAAVAIAKPNYADMKLIAVETKSESIISFMSIGWGLLADIDIESEKFRRLLGPARFTAGAVLRWASLRTYRGRLSFKLVDNAKSDFLYSPTHLVEKRKSTDLPKAASLKNMRYTQSFYDADYDEPVDAVASLDVEDVDDGLTTFSATGGKWDEEDLQTSDLVKNQLNGVSTVEKGFSTLIPMPSLDHPVPDDWTTIEDEFILIYAVYLTHIGSDLPYMPECRFDDDRIYLSLIRSSTTSRVDLAKFLLTIESARHLESPSMEVYPVSAFRLDRLTDDGILTVDGEHIKCDGPLQACVSRHRASVMTVHSEYSTTSICRL